MCPRAHCVPGGVGPGDGTGSGRQKWVGLTGAINAENLGALPRACGGPGGDGQVDKKPPEWGSRGPSSPEPLPSVRPAAECSWRELGGESRVGASLEVPPPAGTRMGMPCRWAPWTCDPQALSEAGDRHASPLSDSFPHQATCLCCSESTPKTEGESVWLHSGDSGMG